MQIRTVSRLHFGLIDLHGGLGRVDGGVGLAIKSPHIEAEAGVSCELEVSGPLSDRIREGAAAVFDGTDGSPVSINVSKAYPQHVGLGSGTQAALTGGTAVAVINNMELSVRKIADITGRGGTSGIGTASFESGGFILDGGHSFEEKKEFLPSSKSPASPPKILSRYEFPDWKIALILPDGSRAYGQRELSIFEENCPIPESEVEQTCRIILMKLLPAVVEKDFEAFRDAIAKMQKVGFKRRELDLQPQSKEIVENLHDEGYAAGMSSLGPIVFAIHPDEVELPKTDHTTWQTRASNSGAKIEY